MLLFSVPLFFTTPPFFLSSLSRLFPRHPVLFPPSHLFFLSFSFFLTYLLSLLGCISCLQYLHKPPLKLLFPLHSAFFILSKFLFSALSLFLAKACLLFLSLTLAFRSLLSCLFGSSLHFFFSSHSLFLPLADFLFMLSSSFFFQFPFLFSSDAHLLLCPTLKFFFSLHAFVLPKLTLDLIPCPHLLASHATFLVLSHLFFFSLALLFPLPLGFGSRFRTALPLLLFPPQPLLFRFPPLFFSPLALLLPLHAVQLPKPPFLFSLLAFYLPLPLLLLPPFSCLLRLLSEFLLISGSRCLLGLLLLSLFLLSLFFLLATQFLSFTLLHLETCCDLFGSMLSLGLRLLDLFFFFILLLVLCFVGMFTSILLHLLFFAAGFLTPLSNISAIQLSSFLFLSALPRFLLLLLHRSTGNFAVQHALLHDVPVADRCAMELFHDS
mmetsp:Transcript_2894/g.6572  ORF Transcript_2894/g.6572 Transcript_2894/m.6572 type:complete len:437 (+) Transcript_2894:2-1312(+)